MFGLGVLEILVLVGLAFLILGPQQFPLMARNFIKFINELKLTFTEIKSELNNLKQESKNQLSEVKEDIEKTMNEINPLTKEIITSESKTNISKEESS